MQLKSEFVATILTIEMRGEKSTQFKLDNGHLMTEWNKKNKIKKAKQIAAETTTTNFQYTQRVIE